MAFPVGLIVVLLAAIGLFTLVFAGVKGISTAVEKSKNYEEYEKLLAPIVLIDPNAFDDITKAEMSQLMEMSLWSLLKSDIAPNTFETNENGIVIPKAAVEEEFVELFGTEIIPVHSTVEGYGIDFVYDSTSETYTVPLTGVTPIYTPDVVNVEKTSDTVVITVACILGSGWEQGENGEMIAPSPDKYLRITLREVDGTTFISAIQNTTAPEIAPTESKIELTTDASNLIDGEKPTETETQETEEKTAAKKTASKKTAAKKTAAKKSTAKKSTTKKTTTTRKKKEAAE